MIKIFRKIRQNLLLEGKTSRYMAYALGEILLVMIGILLALQVNNWNQDRTNKRSEQKILMDLKTEIQTNREKFAFSIRRREKLHQPVQNYMNLKIQNKVTFEDFLEVHKKNFFSGTTEPSFGVINSVISSGSIHLIQNDSLKYLLTDWKDLVANFIDVEEKVFSGHRLFTEYFVDKFPHQENKYHNFTMEELENRYNHISEDVEYTNRMILIQQHLEVGIMYGRELIDYIDQMTLMISKELNMAN